jgi:aspartate carbamoyltransferase catalytic subunit
MKLDHFVSVESLSNEDVLSLLKRAKAFKHGELPAPLSKLTFASNLFFENSTRTHMSFQVAESRLGLDALEFDVSTSSVSKGETLYDTVLTLDALGVEVVVIRHPEENYYQALIESENIHCAIINGGDGSGQHPSQCLLDLFTILEEFGTFNGLKVVISGDLMHSRVARSNMMMLHRLGAEVYFCAPEEWYPAKEFDAYGKFISIDEAVEFADVMMMLRVQTERHDGEETMSKSEYHERYGLTIARANRLKKEAIIMHPAPVNRDVEVADTLVEAENSRIKEQMTNGVFARMAILEAVLKGREV